MHCLFTATYSGMIGYDGATPFVQRRDDGFGPSRLLLDEVLDCSRRRNLLSLYTHSRWLSLLDSRLETLSLA